MPIWISIGEAIGILRARSGITQEKFARLVKRHERTISNWERGETKPDFEEITMICEIFKRRLPKDDITLEWLLGLQGKQFFIYHTKDKP